MTSDSRANFEEWAKQFHYDLTISDPAYVNRPYVNDFTDWSWQAWSARDSEVERLREDAERYRWLRQAIATSDLEEQDRALDALNAACGNPVTPSDFDAAIDAACAALSAQVKESGK